MAGTERQDQIRSMQCGQQHIVFGLRYSKRKTLAIQVYPDQSVRVTVPLRTPLIEIEQLLKQRADWISKQQRYFANLPPPLPPRRYCEGELFPYLGDSYPLKLLRSKRSIVSLRDNQLNVYLSNLKNSQKIQRLVRTWYDQQAEKVFVEQSGMCLARVTELGIPTPALWRQRWLKRRWGNCSHDGKITLNTSLVGAPVTCIDYVIIHELCHLREFNHSKAFYRLQERILPDWRTRKQLLNQTVEIMTWEPVAEDIDAT